MNIRVTKLLGDATVMTEVEDIEFWQLPHTLMMVRDDYIPSQADVDWMKEMS